MKVALPINYWRADLSGWIGSGIMLGFAGVAAWRWHDSGLIFYALTFLRDVAASWFLLTRKEDSARRKFGASDLLAYTSSAMPLMYLAPRDGVSIEIFAVSNCLAILGFTLSTLALFDLGRSFGVSAANRGKIKTGLYEIFSHPMYIGYGISEIGLVLLNPWNGIVFSISSFLYYLRTTIEDKVLSSGTISEIDPKIIPKETVHGAGGLVTLLVSSYTAGASLK